MRTPLIEGILLGFTLAVLMGPAFFSLLQTSIHRGFRSGALMAVGIFLSDLTLVFAGYMGVTQILYNPEHYLTFGLAGGIVLVAFGVYTFNRKIVFKTDGISPVVEVKKYGPITYLLKGYFLNIINPMLIIFWMSVMGFVSANYSPDGDNINTSAIVLFFSGTLLTVLCTDILKCYIANRIKNSLKPNVILWINRIVGIVLMAFGVILIFRVVFNFYLPGTTGF